MRRAIPLVAMVTALFGLSFAPVRAIAAPVAQASLPPTTPAAVAVSTPGPIAATQLELQRQGYTPGPANGVMTEPTERAIRLYERRNGHPPDALSAGDPVRRAQAGLHALGVLANPPDGAIGAQTRDAIIRFEAARHLPIDPRVSDRVLAAISSETAAKTASAPPQPAPQATPAPQPSPAPAAAETGRQPLPPEVTPPPIR